MVEWPGRVLTQAHRYVDTSGRGVSPGGAVQCLGELFPVWACRVETERHVSEATRRSDMGDNDLAMLVAAGGVLAASWALLYVRKKAPSPTLAAASFQQQREHLEADFFQAAARSGKPRGLRW